MKRLSSQRGVAVVTALLLTTLAVTIVASLFWQQQVQVRSMENQRLQLQTKWILRGALDWARLILREDGRFSTVDHMGEPWAVKLAETRLDDYIERDRAEGDPTDAALSGYIVDAQSRYNLRNLARNGVPDAKEAAAYRRLLANLRLPPELADATVQAVAADRPPVVQEGQGGPGAPQGTPVQAAGQPLRLMQVDDLLSIPGYTPEIVKALQDYVAVLPQQAERTPVNVNTAPPEVIAAVAPEISLPEAQALAAGRERAWFKDLGDFKNRANKASLANEGAIAVQTGFFYVFGLVRLDRASLQTLALLQRDPYNHTVRIRWIREN